MSSTVKFEALGDVVLLEPVPPGTTKGGIALPESYKDDVGLCRVVAAGPGVFNPHSGQVVPMDVKPGDYVYAVTANHPLPIQLEGKPYIIVRNRELLGKLPADV